MRDAAKEAGEWAKANMSLVRSSPGSTRTRGDGYTSGYQAGGNAPMGKAARGAATRGQLT